MNKRHGFLDLAKSGRNSKTRWIFGTIIILIGFLIIGSLPSVFICSDEIAGFDCSDLNLTNIYDAPPIILEYILVHWSFIIGIISIFITSRFVHKRGLTQIITHRITIDYDRVFYGMKIGLIIFTIDLILAFFLGAKPILNEFSAPEYITFFLFAIILTPIQASAEEIFFRGYILQGTSLITDSNIKLAIINGILFTLWHIGNPEFINAISFYFFFGIITTFITIKDNGIELAMGLHAINNLFVFLIISPAIDPLAGLSLFKAENMTFSFGILLFPVVYAVFSKKYEWKDAWVEKLFQKINIPV